MKTITFDIKVANRRALGAHRNASSHCDAFQVDATRKGRYLHTSLAHA